MILIGHKVAKQKVNETILVLSKFGETKIGNPIHKDPLHLLSFQL